MILRIINSFNKPIAYFHSWSNNTTVIDYKHIFVFICERAKLIL